MVFKEIGEFFNNRNRSKFVENGEYLELAKQVLGLDDVGIENLKKRIEKFGGKVRTIMHPKFTEDTSWANSDKLHKNIFNYYERVLRNSVKSENSAPLFIFEEQDRTERRELEIRRELRTSGVTETKQNKNIFLIPTHSNTGIPSLGTPPQRKSFLERGDNFKTIEEKEFLVLQKIFELLGVTTLVTSGMYRDMCLADFIKNTKKSGFTISESGPVAYGEEELV